MRLNPLNLLVLIHWSFWVAFQRRECRCWSIDWKLKLGLSLVWRCILCKDWCWSSLEQSFIFSIVVSLELWVSHGLGNFEDSVSSSITWQFRLIWLRFQVFIEFTLKAYRHAFDQFWTQICFKKRLWTHSLICSHLASVHVLTMIKTQG